LSYEHSITIVAFAPAVALLPRLSSIVAPWDTLIVSVGLYIIIPVIFAQELCNRLVAKGNVNPEKAVAVLGPYSIGALLLALVLLFA
jgi:ACR3 family arsenite transporter